MDLGLTEAQEILKTTAANFIQQEYPKETIIALESTPTGVTSELFRKVAELGWLGIVIPEVYGGEGRSCTDAAVLFEELGHGPVPGPYFSSGVLGALTVLTAKGVVPTTAHVATGALILGTSFLLTIRAFGMVVRRRTAVIYPFREPAWK